jgi:hypothetical protein
MTYNVVKMENVIVRKTMNTTDSWPNEFYILKTLKEIKIKIRKYL